jgi:phytoene dehydrogenase-like protein
MPSFDAIVIGSGPNGLAAAITLARAGRHVLLREGAATVGGSMRSAELTLPGFTHDICSTVHALAVASPFMRSVLRDGSPSLPVTFDRPAIAFAHPLDDEPAALSFQSLDDTADGLGIDAAKYRALFSPLQDAWEELFDAILGPLRFPRDPLLLARFGVSALRSAESLAQSHFRTERGRALFAGAAAHSILPLDRSATAAFGLVLMLAAHVDGWPVVRGGSQQLSNALANHFISLGGVVQTDAPVTSVDEFAGAKAILCDVTPRQLIRLAGDRLPTRYRQRLGRYQYGPGVFKMDFALSSPIPWKDPACARAGTVHLGGTLAEVAIAEAAPWQGQHAERPFLLLVQPTICDPTRAPAGRHIAWAYCHVPNGSIVDMSERIESQIERFAPGFRDCVLARHTFRTDELERYNPNLIGGDINGGAQHLGQLFTRPLAQFNPYATPLKNVFLCSSSTPPGGGVHGMCGYYAARTALSVTRVSNPCKQREE